MSKQELLEGLTKEQKDKVQNCKNADELMALAKEEGIELTDEQLAVVAGGGCGVVKSCYICFTCYFCGYACSIYNETLNW